MYRASPDPTLLAGFFPAKEVDKLINQAILILNEQSNVNTIPIDSSDADVIRKKSSLVVVGDIHGQVILVYFVVLYLSFMTYVLYLKLKVVFHLMLS